MENQRNGLLLICFKLKMNKLLLLLLCDGTERKMSYFYRAMNWLVDSFKLLPLCAIVNLCLTQFGVPIFNSMLVVPFLLCSKFKIEQNYWIGPAQNVFFLLLLLLFETICDNFSPVLYKMNAVVVCLFFFCSTVHSLLMIKRK